MNAETRINKGDRVRVVSVDAGITLTEHNKCGTVLWRLSTPRDLTDKPPGWLTLLVLIDGASEPVMFNDSELQPAALESEASQ